MSERKGIGGHHRGFRGRTDDWITPRGIIEALGPFDLDPCACVPQPWPCANQQWTVDDNGFLRPWGGRVWLNPPYGNLAERWLARLAAHGCGTALIFARTETAMWERWIWGRATAVLFLYGRLYFHYPDGRRAEANSGAPSALVAYGDGDAKRLAESSLRGAWCSGWRHKE